jgi:hypothetical protein
MFIVDILLYLVIGFYLDKVLPKEFGTPEPFYFLFTRKFWCGDEIKPSSKVYPLRKESNNKYLLIIS